MRWFRRHTLGKSIVMGRLTFESFGAKPLPERKNIIISRDPSYQATGAQVVGSIDEAINAAGDVEELMVIGGASLYEQTLPRADRLYMTLVHADIEGDAWFPAFDQSQWQEVIREEHKSDERNAYDCSFLIFDKKANQ